MHPSFSHEQRLPSTKLTKDFLLSLERYLLGRLRDVTEVDETQLRESLSIEIEDGLGTEKLNSFESMSRSNFSDSTSRIRIALKTPSRIDDISVRIRLSFARGRPFSTISIDATKKDARETVLAIRDGLLRYLDQQRTWHWIAHPTGNVFSVALGASLVVGYLLHSATGKEPYFPFAFPLLMFAWLYMFGAGALRAYTVFDSRASERADKVWAWFLGGLGTFLVFGTLLAFFRRPLLGF